MINIKKTCVWAIRVAEWLNAPAVKAGGVRDLREFESHLERQISASG